MPYGSDTQGAAMPHTAAHPMIHREGAGSMLMQLSCPLTLAAEQGDGASTEDRKMRFSGIAYSGGIAVKYGTRMVIDLDGMEVPERCPSMYNHVDRVGFCEKIEKAGGKLAVAGRLLEGNDMAVSISRDGQQGYPFEMSVWVDFTSDPVFVPEDTAVSVNGQTFKGPVFVISKSALREVSIVDVGADPNTQARIAAAASGQHTEEEIMRIFNKKATLSALLEGLTDEERDEAMGILKAQAEAALAEDDEEKPDEAETKAEGEEDDEETEEDDAEMEGEEDGADPVEDEDMTKNAATIEQLKSVPGATSDEVLNALERKLSLTDFQNELIVSLRQRADSAADAGGADPVALGNSNPNLRLSGDKGKTFSGCAGTDPAADWNASEQLRAHWNKKGNGGRAAFMRFAAMQQRAGDDWTGPLFDEDAA